MVSSPVDVGESQAWPQWGGRTEYRRQRGVASSLDRITPTFLNQANAAFLVGSISTRGEKPSQVRLGRGCSVAAWFHQAEEPTEAGKLGGREAGGDCSICMPHQNEESAFRHSKISPRMAWRAFSPNKKNQLTLLRGIEKPVFRVK